MTLEKLKRQAKISIYGEKAKNCTNDYKKIEFFDSSKEAFFIDSINSTELNQKRITKDLDDAYYIYANMKKLNEGELEKLKSLPWSEYPEVLKIFLFDFCILNGEAYSEHFVNKENIK
tara:strand:+ start:45 stop:398 length:354 start_codon:yes stop_codon:yes gene_type:complete